MILGAKLKVAIIVPVLIDKKTAIGGVEEPFQSCDYGNPIFRGMSDGTVMVLH